MKSKNVCLIILGLILFIPLINFSNAQSSYVGLQNGDKFEWALSIYTSNWNTYMTDDLGTILENLIPLGSANITRVFDDWSVFTSTPQSYWPLTVISIGSEETGQLLSPNDNTTITSSSVYGTFGWIIPTDSLEWDENWYIVNDTSSFLQQTVNLGRSFSPYAMFNVLFSPITINWQSLVSNFLVVMDSKGGLYKNITASSQPNGYLIEIPAFGFENNSVAININVQYNSQGVLSFYEFSYGGRTLLDFVPGKYIPENERLPDQYIYMFIGLTVIFVAEVIFYIITRKRS